MSKTLALLFLPIIVILFPYQVIQIYNTVLGRIFLIALIIFITLDNVHLGIIFVLVLIVTLRMFYRENFENKIKVLTRMETEKEQDNEKQNNGVDIQSIEENIRPSSSKELPINQNIFDGDNVMPNEEPFSCMATNITI
jgi:hypothetical protein